MQAAVMRIEIKVSSMVISPSDHAAAPFRSFSDFSLSGVIASTPLPSILILILYYDEVGLSTYRDNP